VVQGLTPDFVLAFVLLGIGLILIVARLVGNLAVRIGQPRVVGEIVAGVLLGPSLLGATIFRWDNAPDVLQCDASRSFAPVGADLASFVPRAPSITECLFPLQSRGVLAILGQIALVLFMFLVGMELDFKSLVGKVRGIVTVSLGVIIAPIVIGLGVGAVLYTERFAFLGPDGLPAQLAFSLFLAAMLAVTAFPVMARILQEKGLTKSPMGAIGVASAAVVTVLMFILVAVARGVASDKTIGEHLMVFLGTAVFLAVMFGPVRMALRPLGDRVRTAGAVHSPEFAIVAIVMFGSAFVADRIGINVIVGGFVAGAVMPERVLMFHEMNSKLAELTGTVLLPIFLAFSGLRTDFTTLGWAWLPGLILFVVAGIVAKWGAGAVSARLGGLTWAEGNVLGVLMNCRGLLVLVVALAAADAKIITPQMQLGGVLMALVTTAMTGPLFDRFLPSVTHEQRPPERTLADGSTEGLELTES
jgi:Kef-type K+ transport system membrane component KefB